MHEEAFATIQRPPALLVSNPALLSARLSLSKPKGLGLQAEAQDWGVDYGPAKPLQHDNGAYYAA